jgi:hypothetical protein
MATVGAMPIAARASDPVFAATAIALVMDSAQSTGSTTRDSRDDFTMAQRHALAELPQVLRCMLTQRVCYRRHGLAGVTCANSSAAFETSVR